MPVHVRRTTRKACVAGVLNLASKFRAVFSFPEQGAFAVAEIKNPTSGPSTAAAEEAHIAVHWKEEEYFYTQK